MRQKQKSILSLLALALLLLCCCITIAAASGSAKPTDYYEKQVRATELLERCFAAVKGYKEELGIPLCEEDLHQTGMLGASYTGITTTLGAVEAKRTAASPDMAALCVRLLHEAGIKQGDTVGAGFSGSFPSMNLALISACESMRVNIVCISSVGSSTYGANNPELTFPEMLWRLHQDGILSTQSAAVTLGGQHDVGNDMDEALLELIRLRLSECGLNLIEEPDFEQNLALREALFQKEGPIDCFVAVGGNVTSMGRGEGGISLGQGLLRSTRVPRLDSSSGLVQRYLAQGMPVINLLNIKKLTSDYALPYDPPVHLQIGRSAVYYDTGYPKIWLTIGFAGTTILLLACTWIRYRPAQQPDNRIRKPAQKRKGKGRHRWIKP